MPSGRIRNPEDSNWPPSFKILRASTGAHSPCVDERCLTYCTQTVSGRTAGRLPTCRAICVRQVFMHELAKLSGQRPRSFTSLMPLDQPAESPELDEIPLPTEGQRPGDYFAPLWPPFLLPKRRDDSMHEDRSGKPISAADALRAAGKAVEVDETDDTDYNAPRDGKPSPPKVWEPGMYVWMTRSKWHALDHMNMMMFSIRAQAGWDNYRARMRTEAEKRRALEQAQPHKTKRQAPVEATPETTPEKVVYEDVTRPRKDEFHPGMVGGRRRSGTALPTYPDVGGQSVLLSLPPPMPSLRPALETLVSPLGRALDLSAKAWKDGSYTDFGQRFYNKLFGEEWREPWQLLGKAWEVMQKKSKGDND